MIKIGFINSKTDKWKISAGILNIKWIVPDNLFKKNLKKQNLFQEINTVSEEVLRYRSPTLIICYFGAITWIYLITFGEGLVQGLRLDLVI